MKSLMKKVLLAVGIKFAIEQIQDMRKPKPSPAARAGKVAAFLGAGGGLAYLLATGRMGEVKKRAIDLIPGRGGSGGREQGETWGSSSGYQPETQNASAAAPDQTVSGASSIPPPPADSVDAASTQSFPASDAPAW